MNRAIQISFTLVLILFATELKAADSQTQTQVQTATGAPAPAVSVHVATQTTVNTVGAPTTVTATLVTTQTATAAELNKKSLLDEYKKARITIERALRHQQASELKEFNAAQRMNANQTRQKDKKERREFFNAHLSGPERRKYVQDLIERKKKFAQSEKDALIAKKKELTEKNEAFTKKWNEQEMEFKKQLEQNLLPSQDLWPKIP